MQSPSSTSWVLISVLSVIAPACAASVDPPEQAGGDGDGDSDQGEEGEGEPDPDEGEGEGEGEGEEAWSCPDLDIAELDSCCEAGAAHCAPAGSFPAALEGAAEPCDGGFCIPDVVIEGGDGYTATPCESIGGVEGACVSVCVPQVRDNLTLLPASTCAEDERCAPCIHPLTHEDTGVCRVLECSGDGGEGEGEGEPLPTFTCDDPPDEPVIDPEIFDPCCDGAHCVPSALVPPEQAESLATCDEEAGICVPDPFIETSGIITPATCVSVAESEGRCVSTCVPEIAAQAALLPQADCADTERCAPCCDPLTGADTGACSLGCDVGPSEACGEPLFETCCSGVGHCIPSDLVPDDQEGNLENCGGGWGEEPSDTLCVPDALQDPEFAGRPCLGEGLLGAYDGVCLPDCLDIPFSFVLDPADCDVGQLCVPCTDPLTGDPTEAPGC